MGPNHTVRLSWDRVHDKFTTKSVLTKNDPSLKTAFHETRYSKGGNIFSLFTGLRSKRNMLVACGVQQITNTAKIIRAQCSGE